MVSFLAWPAHLAWIGDYHRFPVSNGYGWSQGKSFPRLDAENILQENDKRMGPQKALLSRWLHNSVAAMRRFGAARFHVNCAIQVIRNRIDIARAESLRTCEIFR